MNRYSHSSALISAILPASDGWVLTSRSWSSEATWYVSSGTSVAKRSAARIASRTRLGRPVAAGQHQAERARRRRRSAASCAPTIAPMTSTRSPGTMTRLRGPIRWSMCSGSIAPIAIPPMTASRSGPGWIVSPWTPSRTIASVGFDRIGRYGQDAEQRDAVARQAALEVRASPGFASRSTLLTIAPATLDPVALEQRGVEHDLVDRPADAALGDDDGRRAEQRRDRRVREPDDRADPGVAGPLDEQDVAIDERGVGRPDARRQVLDDVALDVGLGEAARDVDRAHLAERLAQAEDLLHEDRVLVGRDAVLDDRALPDRLQEARRQAAPQEPVEDAEADRGLAPVLPGRGEVDVAHRRRRGSQLRARAVLRSMSWIASRSRPSVSASTASGSRYGPRRSMMSATRLRKTLASATKNCGSLL